MDGYSITKNGKWLTSMGALTTGKLSFTDNPEHRSIYDNLDRAISISNFYQDCEVINEHSKLTVYPESDELCAWCRCSLAYGYVEYRGALFCSQSCIDDAIGE